MLTSAQAYRMLDNVSVWQVARRCHDLLRAADIPYGVCGGVAVCLHGYQRNTVDLDLIIQLDDTDRVKALLQDHGFAWNPKRKEFTTEDGFMVQFLIAGTKAGKGSEVRIVAPEGDRNVEEKEGLSVVRLSRLIEMKIACGTGNLRRTHKDFADVVELIAIRKLDSSFARCLHKSVRPTYRELVRNATASDLE